MVCIVRSFGVIAICACLSACGSSSDDAAPASGGQGGASGAAGASGSGGAAGAAGCTGDPAPEARCIGSVSGRVVDAVGAGVAARSVSVCGGICYYGESDATGAFSVLVDARLDPSQYSTLPHGRPDRTSFYFALPADASDDVTLGDLLVLELPPSGPLLVVKSDKAGAPAQTVVSNGVTLDVPDGVSVKIDVEDIAEGDLGKMFRALRIPDDKMSAFADPSLGLSALFQLTPFEAEMRDAAGQPALARIGFDNIGLPPGTAVELLGLGSYLFPEWIAPAQFQVVATGAVTSDGSRIELDPGQGLGYLTWVGIREKQ